MSLIIVHAHCMLTFLLSASRVTKPTNSAVFTLEAGNLLSPQDYLNFLAQHLLRVSNHVFREIPGHYRAHIDTDAFLKSFSIVDQDRRIAADPWPEGPDGSSEVPHVTPASRSSTEQPVTTDSSLLSIKLPETGAQSTASVPPSPDNPVDISASTKTDAPQPTQTRLAARRENMLRYLHHLEHYSSLTPGYCTRRYDETRKLLSINKPSGRASRMLSILLSLSSSTNPNCLESWTATLREHDKLKNGSFSYHSYTVFVLTFRSQERSLRSRKSTVRRACLPDLIYSHLFDR
jgi:hypothetical protein